jgi:hypothetical protein
VNPDTASLRNRHLPFAVLIKNVVSPRDPVYTRSGYANDPGYGKTRRFIIACNLEVEPTMRRFLALVLLAVVLFQSNQAIAQPARAAAEPVLSESNWRPIVVGLGAIAGVVTFNVLAIGVEALPGGMADAAGATVPAEASVAISRVYATTSAVVGAWIAYYGFGR